MELKPKRRMKLVVAYSGGKDSQAALLWAVNESGFKNVEAVFCDTGWEHELTYKHITETTTALGVKLVTLKSKKYDGMIDMVKKKGRFPSTKARFCTEELKSKPMIDYILEQNENLLIVQGIRKDESNARSKMQKQCYYFKYYEQPYGHDKNGKERKHTYRKKEVLKWRKEFCDDILRPCFDWTAQQTIDYIIQSGQKPNPLYYKGMARVGCMPCIMCRHSEVKSMVEFLPESVIRLQEAEKEVGRTFFPPDYIPNRFATKRDEKTGKKVPTIGDVIKYVTDDVNQQSLFEEDKGDHRCMSFYGVCE